MRYIRMIITAWLLPVCLLLLGCEADQQSADAGSGSASITISINTGGALRPSKAARVAGKLAGIPDEITQIDISITDTSGQVIAAGDLVASNGALTLQVTAGEPLTITGAARASNELLFAGNTEISALRPNERRSVGLRLNEQVSVNVTAPAAITAIDTPLQMQASINGLNDSTLRWYVNGVVGGSAEFGFIDANGLYTPPSVLPVNPVVVIRGEPVAAPSFAEETSITLNGLVRYTVRTSAGTGGSISPVSVSVASGATVSFTVTPNPGYSIAGVTGCNGALTSNRYTTGAITANCTVSASFAVVSSYTVSATAGVGGSISPASASVASGATTSFTVTPDAGYSIAGVTGCNGVLSGNTYTTGAITADCTVSASFVLVNSAPVATDASFNVNDGAVLSDTLSATDADGDPLVFSIVNGAASGTVVITDSATGAFTYTPNTGAIAQDSFTFRVNDGMQNSAVATVNVSVGRIININSRVNGAPPQFPTVDTVLQPGNYVVALISPAEDSQALYQAWRYGNTSPWITQWAAVRSGGTGTLSGGNITDANGNPWTSAADAYNNSFNRASGVVVSAAETFGFYIGDNQLTDNQGGVSLRIAVAGDGDLDSDGLTDLQEVSVYGTRPGNPDSDSDGLNDGDEVNVALTNPLDPDTDYDGLKDGVETNTGVYISAVDSGTDPNVADSDGDLRYDGAEVYFATDPQDSASFDLNIPATVRINTASGAFESNQAAATRSVSETGRYIAFHSAATNLVANDSNGFADIFLKDTVTWQVKLISKGMNGAEANNYSRHAAVSADGRYVAFYSEASNLVPGDTNNAGDVFRADTVTGVIERVNTDVNGNQTQGAEGAVEDAYQNVIDISADGNRIAFTSKATDLIAGVGNGFVQYYVKDMTTGGVTLVSSDSAGVIGNADSIAPGVSSRALDISFNGRFVAFVSGATNLVASDTNGFDDIFVKDLSTGVTTRVSTSSGGGQLSDRSVSPHLSADGRYVAFGSQANNVIAGDVNSAGTGCGYDAYVKDRQTDSTMIVSTDSLGNQPPAYCNTGNTPRLSADARFVAFESANNDLVPDDNNLSATNPPTSADNGRDIFIKDRVTGQIVLVSRDAAGNSANSGNFAPDFSADGRFALYYSLSDNLAPDDANNVSDIFRSVNPMAAFDLAADDDGDGLSNETEMTTTFTLYFNADTDGDGVGDGVEVSNGTDPNNPNN